MFYSVSEAILNDVKKLKELAEELHMDISIKIVLNQIKTIVLTPKN